MSQQTDRETLTQILQAENIEAVPFSQLLKLFWGEERITDEYGHI